MPSRTQNMFEREFGNYTSAHSRSSNARLAAAFQESPIHSGEGTSIGIEPGIPGFTRADYKEWYENNVLSGHFPALSDFDSIGPGYDYHDSPSIPGDVDPEGESAPGEDGSSIAANGKVPNVATLGTGTGIPDLESTVMVDASEASSPAPFVESTNTDPNASSVAQGNGRPLTQPTTLGSYGN